MIEFLKSWILNIATIAVLLILIEILIPSGKTKKLVNLVSGFILLITIIQPFLKFLWKSNELNWINELNWSNEINSSFNSLANIDITKEEFREEQVKQIIRVYKKRIEGQIKEIAKEVEGVENVEADIILNEDFSSQRFGEIKRVYVYLEVNGKEWKKRKEYEDKREEDKDHNIIQVKGINEVRINLGKQEDGEESDVIDNYKKEIIIGLEEKLHRFLMLKKEDIVISFE